MEHIIDHIDELLDFFPVNKTTQRIRMDLIEATSIDYNQQIQDGVDNQEASKNIISQIANPETFATMIPNSHNTSYYVYWAIAIVTTCLVFSYVSKPDFLQIFLPARMEFPDIIEKYIHYFFITLLSYAGIYLGYRYLPQKLLNRNEIQSATFLYIGTIMAALYFAIAIAFVWYTLNGFIASHITFDIVSTFIYTFYRIFFKSDVIVTLYAVVNALMFVLSRQAYHLETKPQPYEFERIYQPLGKENTISSPTLVETTEQVSPFSKLLGLFKKQKNTKKEEEQPENPALIVTEEVISFYNQL